LAQPGGLHGYWRRGPCPPLTVEPTLGEGGSGSGARCWGGGRMAVVERIWVGTIIISGQRPSWRAKRQAWRTEAVEAQGGHFHVDLILARSEAR
jgi:hypothetical protein